MKKHIPWFARMWGSCEEERLTTGRRRAHGSKLQEAAGFRLELQELLHGWEQQDFGWLQWGSFRLAEEGLRQRRGRVFGWKKGAHGCNSGEAAFGWQKKEFGWDSGGVRLAAVGKLSAGRRGNSAGTVEEFGWEFQQGTGEATAIAKGSSAGTVKEFGWEFQQGTGEATAIAKGSSAGTVKEFGWEFQQGSRFTVKHSRGSRFSQQRQQVFSKKNL